MSGKSKKTAHIIELRKKNRELKDANAFLLDRMNRMAHKFQSACSLFYDTGKDAGPDDSFADAWREWEEMNDVK